MMERPDAVERAQEARLVLRGAGRATAALVLGGFFGLILCGRLFEPEERPALRGLLAASVRSWVIPHGAATYRFEGGSLRLAHADALLQYERALRRPATFVLRQLSWRVGLSLVGSFFVAAYVGRRQRRALTRSRRRGPTLRDVAEEASALRRVVLATGGVLAMATGWWVVDRSGTLFDLILAATARRLSPVATLLEPAGVEGVGWFRVDGRSGFFRFEDVEAELGGLYVGGTGGALVFFVVLTGLLFAGWVFGARRIADRRREAHPGIEVAGVAIPPGKECYHLLVCGSPGSGKSTAIKHVLDQVRAQGLRAIVYDLSGEYVERYFREDRDVLLNPCDKRSAHWSPWADASSAEEYTSIGRSLFPSTRMDREAYWADASATLVSSALAALAAAKDERVGGLYHAFTKAPLEVLHEFLANTPAARLLDAKAGAMPANLIANVTSRLESWALLPDVPVEKAFSLRRFVTEPNEDRWLFLSTSEGQAALLKPLLSLWADIASTALLSLPVQAGEGAKVFVALDELPSLQRLPALPGLLERGRKHGTAVVLGLQSFAQLREAYGHDMAAALAAQPQTWLVLRCVEPDTARWLEAALGQVEEDELEATVGLGSNGNLGLARRTHTRPLVLASEIGGLPDLTGYLRLPGSPDVFRVSYGIRR